MSSNISRNLITEKKSVFIFVFTAHPIISKYQVIFRNVVSYKVGNESAST